MVLILECMPQVLDNNRIGAVGEYIKENTNDEAVRIVQRFANVKLSHQKFIG